MKHNRCGCYSCCGSRPYEWHHFPCGFFTITLTALACASIAGIVLNLIFPEKDFDPEQAFKADTDSKQINLESDYGKKKVKNDAE